MTTFRKLIPFAVALVMSAVGAAEMASAGTADMTDPVAFVQERTSAVLTALDGKRDEVRQDPAVAQEIVRRELLPHIDVEYISRLVLGVHWRRASEEQRQEFKQAFEHFLSSSYAQGLAEFTEDRMRVMPLRGEPDERRTIVQTEVYRANGQPVPVAYTLRWTQDGWKLYDVIIEGISYVRNYRNDFNTEVEQDGLEALIARLRKGSDEPGEAPTAPETEQ